jgi:hypothetical protein
MSKGIREETRQELNEPSHWTSEKLLSGEATWQW